MIKSRKYFNFQESFFSIQDFKYQFNKKVATGSFQIVVVNESGIQNGLFSYEMIIFKEVVRQKFVYEARTKASESDNNYSDRFIKTSIDACKVYEGVLKATSFTKLVFQKYFENLNMNLSCPLPVNKSIILTNSPYSDSMLPFLGEKHVLLKHESLGTIKGEKGWIKMYSFDLKFYFKKMISFG